MNFIKETASRKLESKLHSCRLRNTSEVYPITVHRMRTDMDVYVVEAEIPIDYACVDGFR